MLDSENKNEQNQVSSTEVPDTSVEECGVLQSSVMNAVIRVCTQHRADDSHKAEFYEK